MPVPEMPAIPVGGYSALDALDPFTGAIIDTFPQAGDGVADLGPVNGMGTVD